MTVPSRDTPLPRFALVDRNLRGAMRFFGQATGTGSIHAFDRAEAVYSGLDYGVFNIAFLTASVSVGRDLSEILTQCSQHYRGHKVRWSFWLCEDLLDPPPRRRSRDIFAEFGLRPISQAPGMMAPSLAPVSRALPQIDVRPVSAPAIRSAFAELTSICFDIPFNIARAVYEPESAWKGSYQGFVAFVRDRPVSIVALVRDQETLGIYSLGTVPECRRRGYGEALLRTAIAQYQKQETLVLESTEAGYPLYRRLGFRDVAKFTVYLTK